MVWIIFLVLNRLIVDSVKVFLEGMTSHWNRLRVVLSCFFQVLIYTLSLRICPSKISAGSSVVFQSGKIAENKLDGCQNFLTGNFLCLQEVAKVIQRHWMSLDKRFKEKTSLLIDPVQPVTSSNITLVRWFLKVSPRFFDVLWDSYPQKVEESKMVQGVRLTLSAFKLQ